MRASRRVTPATRGRSLAALDAETERTLRLIAEVFADVCPVLVWDAERQQWRVVRPVKEP